MELPRLYEYLSGNDEEIMTQDSEDKIKEKFDAISPFLDEKATRLWCATEARAYGYGGITLVSNATNVSRTTIKRGIEELKKTSTQDVTKTRQPGGGRKKISTKDATIVSDLQNSITSGALCWTEKSVQQITNILTFKGHRVSARTVNRMLKNMGYSVQRKEQNFQEQCEHINKCITDRLQQDLSIIYIEITQKAHKTKSKKQKLESNSKDLLNKNIGIDKTHFVIDCLYTWGERKKTDGKSTLSIVTHACYIKNEKYWLRGLQNFANKYRISLNLHLVGSGIKKWNLPTAKMHVLYPEKYNNEKKQNIATIYFSSTEKTKSITTVIRDQQQANLVETKHSIERDSFLGNWNYVVKPINNKTICNEDKHG